ncbi:MAG: hemolysin family protein, partial [Planctomycetota bacterium]
DANGCRTEQLGVTMTATLFLVVGVTLVVSAFCSLLEATLYSTRVASLEAARADGNHPAAAGHMLKLKRDVSKPTSAILILNTIANTAGATVAGMLAAKVWGSGAVPLFSAALTAAILFMSEIIPKTFGAVHWRTIWPLAALPLKGLVTVMRPFVWVTEHVSALIVSRSRKAPVTTEAEIVAMIHMGAGAGQLTRTETELLTSVFHFDDLVTSDVMIPWTNVVRIEAQWSREQCLETIRSAGHSRYPVCDASGLVLGILNVTDYATSTDDARIDSILRPAVKVPESLPVPALLRDMQAQPAHVAIVVDEYGNTTGLVTVVDLIEEIVGVLGDEVKQREPEMQREGANVYLVSGVVPITRVMRDVGIELPERPNARSMSGWLAAHLGRLPRVGDEVRIEGATVTVERVVSHRADRVRVVVHDVLDSSEDPESPA